MNCKRIKNEQYDLIRSWWVLRTGVAPSEEILSETGWVAYHSEEPIAALWLYPIEGSKVAWVGWPVSDPESSKEIRDEALDALFDIIEGEARQRGYTRLITTSGIPAVQDRLQGRGYETGDVGINQYWRAI